MLIGQKTKSLELKWSKADGHFLSGKIMAWVEDGTTDRDSH